MGEGEFTPGTVRRNVDRDAARVGIGVLADGPGEGETARPLELGIDAVVVQLFALPVDDERKLSAGPGVGAEYHDPLVTDCRAEHPLAEGVRRYPRVEHALRRRGELPCDGDLEVAAAIAHPPILIRFARAAKRG